MRLRLLVVGLVWISACGGGSSMPTSPAPPPVPATPVISLNGNLAFGEVLVGSKTTNTLTIANTGTAALVVSSLTAPTGYTANWTSGTIPAGGSQAVIVEFAPTVAGESSGAITVNGNHTSGSNSIPVSSSVFPNLNGMWSGTFTISFAGTSRTCNMSWTVSGQTGSSFSGSWQTFPDGSCGGRSTLVGRVSTDGGLSGVDLAIGTGNCVRIAGDGLFGGVLSGTTATIQASETLRCEVQNPFGGSSTQEIMGTRSALMRKQ